MTLEQLIERAILKRDAEQAEWEARFDAWLDTVDAALADILVRESTGVWYV